jgi:NDP-sugar pyrophosphorylase family protein
MKKRVSLSIDSEIIKEIDSIVDGIEIRSRSDAIEKILKKHLLDRKSAVILAGGEPENLIVGGLNVYRPLVSIGKKKLIEDVVLKCREAGFTNIIIIAHTVLISKLYEVLGNGEKYGVNINYVEEKKNLGSAKTLELAKKFLRNDFLFLPCDSYFDFDLRNLFEFHNSHTGVVTIGVHTRTSYDWRRGILEMDGYNIINIEEKPKVPKTHLAGIFIGFMKFDIFNYIPPGEVVWSLQDNVFPKLVEERKLIGYPIAGEWVNIHTKEDLNNLLKILSKK